MSNQSIYLSPASVDPASAGALRVTEELHAQAVMLEKHFKQEYDATGSDEALFYWQEWGREKSRLLNIIQIHRCAEKYTRGC
jgi:hypothetical protein